MSQPSRPEYSKTYITTAVTTAVFSGKGILGRLTLNEVSAGTITLLDGGVAFALIAAATPAQTFIYDVTIANALSITTAGADDVTVSWARP